MAYTGFEHDLNVWVARGCEFPLLDVTLTWTDSDTTKGYLGIDFTNGETKAICPHYYQCDYTYVNNVTDPNDTNYTLDKRELWQLFNYKSYTGIQRYITRYDTLDGVTTNTFSDTDTDTLQSNMWLVTRFEKKRAYKYYPPYTFYGYTEPAKQLYDATTYYGQYFSVARLYTYNEGYAISYFRERYKTSFIGYGGSGASTYGFWRKRVKSNSVSSISPTIDQARATILGSLKNSPIGTGTMTTSSGITIAWQPNDTGVKWGACFP